MKMPVSGGLSAVTLSVLLVVPVPQPLQNDRSFIQAAIADGLGGDVQPYVLRQNHTPHVVVGVIYTPYVRVARFARAARERGAVVSIDDIPEAVTAPVVHVAMRSLPEDRSNGSQPFRIAAITRPPARYPPAGSSYFAPRNLHEPIRVMSRASAETVIGELSYGDVDLIGVFAESLVRRQWIEFALYQEYTTEQGSPGYSVSQGYVKGPLR
jgi:hypothetical protein